MLIVFAGLPGAGKSSIARALAQEIGAQWLRVDSIEQAFKDSGVVSGSLDDAGYRAANALAEDNLRLGRTVIGDSVNPWKLTRDAWRDVGLRAGVEVAEVEIICSEEQEHRVRIEARDADIPGLTQPDWHAVTERDYHPWDRDHIIIDTAQQNIEQCVAQIRAVLSV